MKVPHVRDRNVEGIDGGGGQRKGGFSHFLLAHSQGLELRPVIPGGKLPQGTIAAFPHL